MLGCLALALLAILAATFAVPGLAEFATGLAPGDTAMSGFSGAILSLESLPPGVAPLDKTVIDPDGSPVSILSLSTLGGAPQGRTINPEVKLSIKAKDIGQVFALTFDAGKDGQPANLYAGATSAYGLQIVSAKPDADGSPVRLKVGAPSAQFMRGQFGGLPGGGPGTIWKIDGATGAVSAIADTAFSGVANSGPGIGGLAFDPKSRNLYASDLDTGLIHRFALDYNAANLGQFDHGVAGRPARGLAPVPDDGMQADITSDAFKANDPSTWGFTQSERRVRGLAVHDGRLYYAVDDGPEIWSVGLNEDGGFADDPRSELLVKAASPSPVTGIAFDGEGRMLLAQRGPQKGGYDFGAFVDPAPTQVLRYSLEAPDDPATPGVWAPVPDAYAAGFANDGKSASGGLSLQYGYTAGGSLDQNSCGGSIVLTADGTTAEGTGHGAQLNAAALVLPANLPPKQSAFIALDSKQSAADLKGHAGGVASFQSCTGESGGFPPVAGSGGGFPSVGGGGGGFPPVAGSGSPGGFPPVGGGQGTFFPPIESGGGGVTETPGGGGTTETPTTGGKITVGQITVEKSGVSKTCNPDDLCTFAIKVTNTGDADIAGPITIGDLFSVGGMVLPQTKLAAAPTEPWTCVSSAAPGMSCTHPGPLKPKSPETLILSFTAGPLGDATEVKNCASLVAPAAPAAPAAPDPPAAPGAPAPPEKKGEALPSGNSVLLKLASLRAAFGTIRSQSLLHRIAGGNIGGAGVPAGSGARSGSCMEIEKGGFSVEPNIGGGVSFVEMQRVGDGWTGVAQRFDTNGVVRGKVTGQITLTSFDLNVVWPDGKGGNYKGTIPADGKVTGQTTDAIFGLGGITGVAPLKCIADPECKLYADIATAKATEFKNLRCGGPYEGRWTLDHRQHSDWCMGQPLSSPLIASEANTRTTELDACKARVAGCDDYAKEGVAMGTEFLNLNCGELPIALSTDFDQQKGLCLNTPTESFITSQRDFRKKALEECKQRIAKNTPPTPAEIPAAPVPVPPATGPQACAVIPVEQDPAAQPVPQGNGLSVSKQAVSKDCSGANGCEFKVTVENTGKDPVNAVTIIDTTTGDGELNLPADDLAVAPKAPWNCARGVPTQCTLQQALPPGAKSEFNIGFKPGAKATAKTLKNCVNAEIAAAAPQDAQPANAEKKAAPACDSLPLTAPPGVPGKIAVVKTGLSCSGAPQVCDFTVAIVNGTDKPLDDTVEFTDELTGDGAAAANAALTSVPEPWTCPKDAQGFKCSAKLQLDAAGGPNAIKNFTFSATLGAGSEAVKEIKNCATMEGLPPSCASLPLAHSHLLRMQKLASDCTLADDKNSESCEFYVMIRNDGSVAYNGPLSFTDLLTGAGQGSVSSSATTAPSTWTCIPGTGTGTTDCSIPSTTIEPGKGPLVILNIRPNTTAKSYQNCATITGPGSIGSDHPSDCVSLNSVMQPPGVPGKVSVIKTGTSCSGSPPVCSFTITVANGTDQPINGPVEFTDELTGDGAPFANAAVTPTEPWTCAKEGQGFKCTATLQLDATGGPNAVKRFSFAATLGDGSNSVKEMKNCATLAGETPSCASLPLANGPLLRVEKLGFDCDLAPDKKSEVCQFAISIRNDGTAPYTGPLTYGDTFTPGGGNQGVPKGWSCDAVGCSVDPSPVTIDPGKDVSALFLMRPALTTATSFQNCATLLDPAAAVSDHATDCVTLTSAFTTSTLTAIKVSTSNGICDLKGSCPFRIVVRNDGPAVFQGNLRVHDGVFETSSKGVAQSVPGKIEAVPSADWTCTNSDARGIDCTPVAAKKVMQVGGTLSLDVLVTPGPGWQKNDILENCVAAFGGDGPAGSSCAEVKLDPFAVKIAKSGDQACKPGSECRFTLDIFNPGPIVHHAPVTVSDNLAGLSGAKIVSITQVSGKQAFPCSPAPTSLPFSCSGRMDLEIGDHNVYAMVVQLPAEAPGQGWFSNCASVSAPETTTVGQAATGGAPSENSCRVVMIENACTGGMELTKDGRCACPAGTNWDGKSCSTPKSDGVGGTNKTAPPPPEKQKTEKQKIVCPPDRPVVSHGNCCPETYEYRDKKCRCPKGKVVIKGLCQVPPKSAPQEPPKEKTCPPNTVLQNGNCRPIACPPGTIGVPPICVQQGQKKEKEKPKEEDCPPGYRKLSKANKYGALCEPIDQGPPKCPADKPNGTPPNCCAPGTRFTEGFCYPDKCSPGWTGLPPHCQPPAQQQQPQPTGPSPKCAPPLIGTPPDCHCPGGYSFDNESKKCERNVQ